MNARGRRRPDIVPNLAEPELRKIYGADADEVIGFGWYLQNASRDDLTLEQRDAIADYEAGRISSSEFLARVRQVTSDARATALALAAEMRAERSVSPFELFEASGRDGELYREAMIHAGALGPKVKSDDEFKPFGVCPMCGAELEGGVDA